MANISGYLPTASCPFFPGQPGSSAVPSCILSLQCPCASGKAGPFSRPKTDLSKLQKPYFPMTVTGWGVSIRDIFAKGTWKFCAVFQAKVFLLSSFPATGKVPPSSLWMRIQVGAATATLGPWGDRLKDECQTLSLAQRKCIWASFN